MELLSPFSVHSSSSSASSSTGCCRLTGLAREDRAAVRAPLLSLCRLPPLALLFAAVLSLPPSRPLRFVGLSASSEMSITSAAGEGGEGERPLDEEADEGANRAGVTGVAEVVEAEGANSAGVVGLVAEEAARCFAEARLDLAGLRGEVLLAFSGDFSCERSHSASDMAARRRAEDGSSSAGLAERLERATLTRGRRRSKQEPLDWLRISSEPQLSTDSSDRCSDGPPPSRPIARASHASACSARLRLSVT